MVKHFNNISWISVVIIAITIVITIIPVKYNAPNWLLLAIGICHIILQQRVNTVYVVFTGIIIDILTGSLLGVNALCLLIANYSLCTFNSDIMRNKILAEIIFFACLAFSLSMLRLFLHRMAILPLLLETSLSTALTTSVIWGLLRLLLRNNKTYYE